MAGLRDPFWIFENAISKLLTSNDESDLKNLLETYLKGKIVYNEAHYVVVE